MSDATTNYVVPESYESAKPFASWAFDEIAAIKHRLDDLTQIDPELMGALTKSISEANHLAGEVKGRLDGLQARIAGVEKLADVTYEQMCGNRNAILTSLAEADDSEVELCELDATDGAMQFAKATAYLFARLMDSGAGASAAANVVIAWIKQQER